jgi:hypothetical protein
MDMNAATINSILARCIVDTAFLDLLASDPSGALNGYALDPQTYSDFLKLDIDRLRNFAGLVTKVQNNGLWEHFLHTRTLLNYYQIDLEVFTAYRATHLWNRQAQLSRNEQIEQFLSFLREYIEAEYSKYPALREILTHEQLTWEIRVSFDAGKRLQSFTRKIDVASLKYDQFMNLVPIISGTLRVQEFTYDPFEVIVNLTQGNFDPRRCSAEPRWFGYWADNSTEQLRIMELDSPIAMFLKEVDGRRSIRRLLRRAIKGARADLRPSEFRPSLEKAFDEGLLTATPGSHAS